MFRGVTTRRPIPQARHWLLGVSSGLRIGELGTLVVISIVLATLSTRYLHELFAWCDLVCWILTQQSNFYIISSAGERSTSSNSFHWFLVIRSGEVVLWHFKTRTPRGAVDHWFMIKNLMIRLFSRLTMVSYHK